MHLAGILERIEARLTALGLSASRASKMAGKPEAIRNIKRSLQKGERHSVTTATLAALAPVLQTTVGWLVTGKEGGDGTLYAEEIVSSEMISVQTAIDGLAWVFETLDGAPEAEARVLARAVIRAIRTPQDQEQSPMSEADRRALVQTAIRLFRPR